MGTPSSSRLTPAAMALAIAGVFVLAMLAVVAADARTGGDETFYTDGALRMLANGDLLTPRTADGALRFQKPPVAYWLVAGSWEVFGISLAAARIPFVLVMGATLWVTFLLGRALFGSDVAGALAAAMLAGNHNVAYAAERAIPDGPLTLFVAVGLLGFARLIAPRSSVAANAASRAVPAASDDGRARVMAWVGSGLAVATKGLLGVVLAGFGASQVLARGRDSSGGRALACPTSMLLGLVVALGWFAAVTARHGAGSLQGFVRDQVVVRLAVGPPLPVNLAAHLPKNLLTVIGDFLPWLLLLALLAALDRERARRFLREHRPAVLFALGWVLLLVVIFSAGPVTRARYLLPAYPAMAAFAAAMLTALADGERARRALGGFGRVCVALAVALGAALVAVGARTDVAIAAAGGTLAAGALLLGWLARGRAWPAGGVALGLGMMLALACYDGPIRGALQESPAPRMIAALDAAGVAGARVVAVGIGKEVLNGVRVGSGGRVWPETVRGAGPGAAARAGAAAALLSPAEAPAFAAAGWRLLPAGWSYAPFRAPAVRALLAGADWAEVQERQRRYHYLALPPG